MVFLGSKVEIERSVQLEQVKRSVLFTAYCHSSEFTYAEDLDKFFGYNKKKLWLDHFRSINNICSYASCSQLCSGNKISCFRIYKTAQLARGIMRGLRL